MTYYLLTGTLSKCSVTLLLTSQSLDVALKKLNLTRQTQKQTTQKPASAKAVVAC